MQALFRLFTDSDIGLGEAIMNGELEVDNEVSLMHILVANAGSYRNSVDFPNRSSAGSGLSGLLAPTFASLAYYAGQWRQSNNHKSRANTVAMSKDNIREHYDVGNKLYELFLDETLTYR